MYLGKPRRWISYKGELSEAPANLIQPHVQMEPLGDVWHDEAIRHITREGREADTTSQSDSLIRKDDIAYQTIDIQ